MWHKVNSTFWWSRSIREHWEPGFSPLTNGVTLDKLLNLGTCFFICMMWWWRVPTSWDYLGLGTLFIKCFKFLTCISCYILYSTCKIFSCLIKMIHKIHTNIIYKGNTKTLHLKFLITDFTSTSGTPKPLSSIGTNFISQYTHYVMGIIYHPNVGKNCSFLQKEQHRNGKQRNEKIC